MERSELPATVEALLQRTGGSRDDAAEWSAFLGTYGDLILHVARSFGGDQDDVHDRYVFILEQLRRDDYARVRRYAADGRGKFTTWLVVVLRRLCLDRHRQKYGRHGATSPGRAGQRRDLVDLIGSSIDVEQIVDEAAAGPEADLRLQELRATLNRALAELQPEDRLLLRLRYEDALSVPEAARRLGLPSPFHGYRRLEHVHSHLRDRLLAAGIEDPVP